MEFNKIWNKRRQTKLLQMNKEGKSSDEIREYFGSLLQYHPNKTYCYNSFIISKFCEYVTYKNNESYINKFNEIDYKITTKYSMFYNFKKDYIIDFNVDGIDYVLVLFYLIDDGNIISYNVAFTTKKQYVEYVDKLEDFLESNEITDMNKELFEELSIILEKHTNINNPNKVLNAVSYVFVEFYKKSLTNIIFSIGETNDSRKIKWYRNIIKHSFEDVEETERLDSYGKIMYYYKINDINIKKQL